MLKTNSLTGASALLIAGAVAGFAAGVAAGALRSRRPAPATAPTYGDADPPSPGVGLSAPVVPTLENAGLRLDQEGAGTYGGIGDELPPELPELAKEIGASIGRANPRPAGDTHGEDAQPHRRD